MEGLLIGLGIGLAIFVGALMLILFVKRFLHICEPHEVLVFEGRKRKLADGSHLDYTVLHSGRGIRIPIIENVRSLDTSTMTVDINVQNAYSRGNIPLNLHAIANVKVCRREGVIDNALERFLGRERTEIRDVAKETIEGALRGVLARLTPEQVNEERATFVHVLANDVEDDLNQLGLTIDTLNIQSVTDNVNYLDNIGRSQIAAVLRDAEISESEKRREAEEVVAESQARGKVAREQAQANIQRAENDLRTERADLNAKARSIEEQTEQAAFEARARAEVRLQEVRTELERLRLQADEVLPAEAQQVAAELLAEGESAEIEAQGEATAQALQLVAQAYRDAGPNAEDIFVLQQLETLLKQVADRLGEVKVANVNLVDGGDGATLGRLAGAYPAMVASIFDAVGETTGVSLKQILQRASREQAPQERPAAGGSPGQPAGTDAEKLGTSRFRRPAEPMRSQQNEETQELPVAPSMSGQAPEPTRAPASQRHEEEEEQ